MPRPWASSVTCLRVTIVSLFIANGELLPNTRTPKANWLGHSILGCDPARYCSQTGSWIRDDIETLPALLTLYEENKLVSPTKGPVTQSLHSFFDGCLNKLLNKLVDLFGIWYNFSLMLRYDVIFPLAIIRYEFQTQHTSDRIYPNSKVHGGNMGPIWGRHLATTRNG